jgi:hypothetical protein
MLERLLNFWILVAFLLAVGCTDGGPSAPICDAAPIAQSRDDDAQALVDTLARRQSEAQALALGVELRMIHVVWTPGGLAAISYLFTNAPGEDRAAVQVAEDSTGRVRELFRVDDAPDFEGQPLTLDDLVIGPARVAQIVGENTPEADLRGMGLVRNGECELEWQFGGFDRGSSEVVRGTVTNRGTLESD